MLNLSFQLPIPLDQSLATVTFQTAHPTMKLLLFLIASLAIAVIGDENNTSWEAWKSKYGRVYATEEEDLYRNAVFLRNVNTIERHNAEADNGLHGHYLRANQFADLLKIEIEALFKYGSQFQNHDSDSATFLRPANYRLPESVDWRKIGAVTGVKNQYPNGTKCGSCWAFAAVRNSLSSFSYIFTNLSFKA